MAAAARLGYRAHWAAKALASNRSGLVGLAVCGATRADLETARSVEQRLGDAGYGCLVGFGPIIGAPAGNLVAFVERGIEALVFVGAAPATQEIEALAARGLPWVAIAEGEDGDPRRIELGQTAGAELAGHYLRELNHEVLAVMGPADGSTARGVARAMEGATLGCAQGSLADDPNAFKRAVHGLLDLPRRPTAIVCCDDTSALMAIRECILRGVRVPKDMSIVGFGDEPIARSALPSLTTVRAATVPAGIHAAEAVLGMMAGRPVEPYAPVVKLAIRESSGPAP